jgi:hypothetical protein
MYPTANIENKQMKTVVRALRQLSPAGQGAVVALVRHLVGRKRISVEVGGSNPPPATNLEVEKPSISKRSRGLLRSC